LGPRPQASWRGDRRRARLADVARRRAVDAASPAQRGAGYEPPWPRRSGLARVVGFADRRPVLRGRRSHVLSPTPARRSTDLDQRHAGDGAADRIARDDTTYSRWRDGSRSEPYLR